MRSKSRTIPSSVSPAPFIQRIRRKSARPSRPSMSEISTSIASAPERWSARILSAASICRGRIPKPVGKIICCFSCRPSPSRKKSAKKCCGFRTCAQFDPLQDAKDGITKDQYHQSQHCRARRPEAACQYYASQIWCDGADEEQNRCTERDCRCPGITPGAVRPMHLRLSLAQNKERGIGERVIRHKEKRQHRDHALKRAQHEQHSSDGAKEQ